MLKLWVILYLDGERKPTTCHVWLVNVTHVKHVIILLKSPCSHELLGKFNGFKYVEFFFFLRARDCIATKRENPLYKMQRHTLFTCSAPGWRPIMSKHRWPAAGEQVKRGPKNIQCWKEEREKRPASTQAGLADPNKTKENLYILKELKHAFPFKKCDVKNEPMIKSKWNRATLANQAPVWYCFFVSISKTCFFEIFFWKKIQGKYLFFSSKYRFFEICF